MASHSPTREEWQDGTHCSGCNKEFTVIRRKHHCRFCGNIFCDSCSSGREGGKRACWQCCATARSASPTLGPTATPVAVNNPAPSTENLNSSLRDAINGGPGSVPTSPSMLPTSTPIRQRFMSIASEGGNSYRDESVIPPPVSSSVSKGKGKAEAEVLRLRQQVAELEGHVSTLTQELNKTKGFFANAFANVCKYEEDRKQQEAAKQERASVLNVSRGEFQKQVSERKHLFSKGKHHMKKCVVCSGGYSVTRREHHCRSCYNSVCGKCSADTLKGQRACKLCVIRTTLSTAEFTKHLESSPQLALAWVSSLDAASEKIWKAASSSTPALPTGSLN